MAVRVYVRVNTVEVRRGRESKGRSLSDPTPARSLHMGSKRPCNRPRIARAVAWSVQLEVGMGRDERRHGSKLPLASSPGMGFCPGQKTCIPSSCCPLSMHFDLGGHSAGRVRGRFCCLRTQCYRCIDRLAMSMNAVFGTCPSAFRRARRTIPSPCMHDPFSSHDPRASPDEDPAISPLLSSAGCPPRLVSSAHPW